MKKMLSFGFAALFALVGAAEEIESSSIDSDIENYYGQNPYGTVCEMFIFKQKTATLKWCSLGTSITWYNDEPRPEVGLTHGYQDRTIEKLGLNKAANFINRGVSGARIGDANTEPPAGSPCDIYTLEWGINDWMRGTRVGNIEIFRRRLANPNDTCADITTEVWYTFAASYARVITQIKAINPNAIIILMTPRKAFNNNNNLNNSMAAHWWDKSTPDSGQQEATYLYDYVKLIRAIGEEIHCPVVDQFRYAANVENLESLSIDKALHPNDAGYEVMANLLAPVMSQAIETKYGITRCTHEGTTSVVPGTAATCTEAGTTAKTVCTNPDCRMVIIPSETIPALGHDWGAWTVTTPATTDATGLKERTCQRAGCDAHEEQIIPRVGEIVALRNIAVVTKVDELPVLPAQVAGLRADGTIAGQCDVVWAEHSAPSAIGKSTITGTATVDNEAMTVTASVRATIEQSDDDIKNIVFGVPPTTVYPMSGITYPYAPLNATTYANQVNGLYENNSFPWGGALGTAKDGDYNGKYAKEVFVFEFTLAKTSTVKGFTVWHMTDSGWLENPYPMFAEVSTDNGTTWISVAVTGGAKPKSSTEVPQSGGGTAYVFKYDYELAAPASSVTNLRLKFSPYGIETPVPGDSTNFKGLKISEIEVFGIEGESGGPLEPLTTDTLTALEVDNVAVQGFAPTTYSYTIKEARAITSATSTDNMGITILPRANGAAHVVTLSESGSTKTYEVVACEHAHQTETPAVDATCTTDGHTQSVYCEDCKRYLESSTEIPALGHAWDEGAITTQPTCTENGVKTYTCTRTGCDETRTEDVDKLGHDWDNGTITTQPTCTENGVKTYTCTRTGCGETRTEDVDKLGHDWSDWVITKEPSKTETGSRKRECQRQDCDAEETEDIPMLADVVSLRNVAVATAIGTAPKLPETVKGLNADGTLADGDYSVVWSSIAAPSAAGITTVTGTAMVNGASMSVTAFVRAAIARGEVVNYTPSATPVEVSYTGGGRNNSYVNILKSEAVSSDTDQWGDYIVYASGSQNSLTIELCWENAIAVSKVTVYYWMDGSNYQFPGEVHWYDTSESDPVEITGVTVGERHSAGSNQEYVEYSFAQPQTLSKLKFIAHPESSSAGRHLMVRRFWVQGYGPGGTVEPTTTDTLTALEVDNQSVTGFAAATCNYTVYDGTAVTSAANDTDNVAVTILPKYNGSAYAVTLSETGKQTKTYSVAMPICTHEQTGTINARTATCTEDGYTGDIVCELCGKTTEEGSVILKLGHDWGEWETTKEPSTTEPGTKRRKCQRDGCDAEETEEIPVLEVPKLILDPRGGSVSPNSVELPADSLPTPTREGYHFVGWFKDEIDATAPYVRGKYLCGEPLTSATVDDKDKILYAKWVKNDVYSHFQGKKVVFVGDSVSTLHGYSAANRQLYTSNIFYSESTATANGITEKNTWWGQLVQALDMDLLSVNAVSGSPVVDSEASIAYDVRAMSGTVRIDDLDVNGTPDVIFIFGGINDFNGNTKATIDDYDPNASYLTDELDLTSDYFPTFAEGYATMLRRIRHYYPNTEIVAIGPYIAASDRDAMKPVFIKGNTTISNLCVRFDVPYLNLMNTQLPYWANGVRMLCDSYHPNQAGFTEFANYVLENYKPACAHANKTESTGVVPATCTTDGYSGDCACLDCGKEFPGHVITKLGHDWGEWETTKEPTRDETGEKKRECLRDGCDAEETQVIPKIADVVALRNVAVATAVGSAPKLPATVAGIKADGTLGGEYDVAWDPVEAPTEEGVTTVLGTATVDGKDMTVTAFVRAEEVSVEYVSVSPNATVASNDPNGKQADFNRLISDSEPSENTVDWATSNRQSVDLVNTLTWSSAVTISKVRVCYSGNHKAPKSYSFSSDSSGSPEIEFTAGQVEEIGVHRWIEFTFNQPTELTTLRCFFGKPDGGWLIVERVWAYEMKIGTIEPQKTDALTALEVDGTTVPDFYPATTSYTVNDGQEITKAVKGSDNVAVTILQKTTTASDNAYVVTLAEDGESTKTYTVSMPKTHDHTFGEWQVITSATVYAPGLRRRTCTWVGCKLYEEEVIPQIQRKTVKWIDVDFANYADASTIANAQVDSVDGGTWAKPDDDDTATVAHGDVDLAALVVTNGFLGYTAKAQTSAGRDATVEFTAKFQKPTTDELPQSLDLGQTAVFVFPKGKNSCYKAYTADGWVELTGATPDFTKFVTITIEFRYEYGERLAMVKIDGVACMPVDAETPWFALAGSVTKLTSVSFFGAFDLGPFEGDYLTTNRGTLMYIR